LSRLLEELTLNFMPGPTGQRLTADGRDITDAIRTPEISMLASAVSARAVVRAYLLNVQRPIGASEGGGFEGRDMGTVVFPEADVKFFLSASENIRAQRRFVEIRDKVGLSIEEVQRDLRRRDEQDSTRDLAPLRAAPDAVMIDSTAAHHRPSGGPDVDAGQGVGGSAMSGRQPQLFYRCIFPPICYT